MPLVCSHDDCQKKPRWKPVLELRTGPRSTPRRLYFNQLGYCDAHRLALEVDTFLSDEGCAKISRAAREAGKGRHDQRHTTLAWERLGPADRLRLARAPHRTTTPDASARDDELAF